jgi:hypothetical protein
MERRKLLATTGAVSLTAAAAVIAIGSNFGVFGLTDGPAKAGHLQPVAATSSTTLPEPPAVIYLDVQDPPLAPASTPPASVDGAHDTDDDSSEYDDGATPPVASTPPASVDGAHQMDDDSSEHDDHGYDGEEHETERDDD